MRWPAGASGAVSLTFDDGMDSQRERALPLLNERSLRATFYLCAPRAAAGKLARWANEAQGGHELGNHTASHPCPENALESPHPLVRSLEEMSVQEYEADLLEAAACLAALAPAQKATSFAYPCYEPFVGRGAGRSSVVPVVTRHCIAGRGRGEAPFANDPWRADLSYLWSWPCERKTASELVGMIDHAVNQNRWAILTFHGIDEGHLSVRPAVFAAVCDHLAERRDAIWTAPVAEVAGHVLKERGGDL